MQKAMRDYTRMVRFVRPHLGQLLAAFGFMLANSLLSSLPIVGLVIPFVDTILAGKPVMIPHSEHLPGFITGLIDRMNGMPRGDLLNFLIVWTIALSFVRLACEFFQSFLMNDVSQKVIRDLRNIVYHRILELPISFFGRSQTGALVSRITHDTTVIRDAISEGLTDFLFQPVQIIANVIVLLSVKFIFGIPWSLVSVIFILLPLVSLPVYKMGRRLKKISREAQTQIADINSMLFETISGIRIVKGFGMERYERDRFSKHNHGLYKTMMRSIKRMILVSPMTEFIGFVCLGIVLYVGGREVINDNMSPGAFITFLVALFSLLRPFKRLSRVHGINQTAMAAAERVFEILDAPDEVEEKPHAKSLGIVKKEIDFENVTFGYSPHKTVLSGIDFKVRAGEIVAVVGPSGAGKTSLVNLLPRFYDPQKGRILIDGHDIRDVTLKSLREQIGIVTQETILFNDTVASNIAYGRSKTPLAEIERAAKTANAHAFIMKMPQKYHTVIGDRGFRLSGGERQRLSIARAVLKNPPVLILDEATSALDTESEGLVQEAIANLMQGRTVLVIAHRLSTIKNADRIVVIDDGRIAEFGSHDDLMAKNGLYKRLYELQFRV